MNQTTLLIIALLVVFFLSMFVIPRFLLKRAIKQVIGAFRHHQATNTKSAKPIHELGLKPRGFIEGLFRGRDYKPYAMGLLQKHEVILMTEDGRLYLSEDKLYLLKLDK